MNLTMPLSWQQLTDSQLLFVFTLIGHDYSSVRVKTLSLFKWGELTVDHTEDSPDSSGTVFYVRHRKQKQLLALTAQQVNDAIQVLNFLDDIPTYPVRLEEIDGNRATRADFQDVTFENYLAIDNLFQGYLQTRRDDLLLQMARILYDNESIHCSKAELISVFYWVASVKQMFGSMFSHIFKPTSTDEAMPAMPTYQQLRDGMNTQIRALTSGDITKESAVLKMDCWRALTELDAKARDYEEMKAQYKK